MAHTPERGNHPELDTGLLYRSPNDLGPISLNGIVVAPRPYKAWRVKPNTAGEERR
jgi:hypothetical protein